MISGIWLRVNSTVIGIVPQTLKATQKSVEKLRQTTSLMMASTMKNRPQRKVSLFQPSSSSWKAELKT